MAEAEAHSQPASFSPLPCATLVYRLARSKAWIDKDTGEFLPAAFELRPDETGLSVEIDDGRALEEIIASVPIRSHGAVTLHVGRVRDIGLDVIPDSQTHAEITRLPQVAEDPLLARYYA